LELALNVDYYANHPFICTKIVENQEHHHQNLIFGLTISLSASNDWSKGKESKEFCLIREAIRNIEENQWGTFICLCALSSVINIPIRSIYPEVEDVYCKVFNGTLNPRPQLSSSSIIKIPISIMWSRVGEIGKEFGVKFTANHFVPIFIFEKGEQVASEQENVVELINFDAKPFKMMKLDGKGRGKKLICICF